MEMKICNLRGRIAYYISALGLLIFGGNGRLMTSQIIAPIILGTLFSFGWASAGFAQDGRCACTTSISDGVSGQIVSVSGQVLSSQQSGLQTAAAGTSIGLGSQVVTGPGSAARIAFGSCSVPMSENSEMLISQTGANLCLQVSEVVAAPPAPNTPAIAVGLGVAAAAAGAAALGGGSDGASP